jgi:hypothetical protein
LNALTPEALDALRDAIEASEERHGPGGFTTIVALQGSTVILAVGASVDDELCLLAGPMTPAAARALAAALVGASDVAEQIDAPAALVSPAGKEWLQ